MCSWPQRCRACWRSRLPLPPPHLHSGALPLHVIHPVAACATYAKKQQLEFFAVLPSLDRGKGLSHYGQTHP